MSRVVEASGAQVLPDVRDERATVSGWVAHQCADADHRVRWPIVREKASTLRVIV